MSTCIATDGGSRGAHRVRVIAGKYRSRRLKSLRGRALRPTSDRLRETLFNILGPEVEDSVFVDVYAGTGAVGIEALSRGARQVLFIEKHRAAVQVMRDNLEALGIRAGAEVLAMDAVQGLKILARRKIGANFVFLDPPYRNVDEYARALEFLSGGGLLAGDGLVIAEHRKQLQLPPCLFGLKTARRVEQGDACLSFFVLAR